MTQSAISSADLTLLRSQHHTISDVRLNVFKPDIVTAVTVDNTPTTNPASELIVTGDVSATVEGQRFIITDTSGNLVNHGTLRLATSGQTLKISPVSIGDTGYVSPIRRAISATDTVTIYKDRPLWGDYSRIVSNTFRKLWDQSYSDENEDAPPIANTGTSQSARVTVGSSASFTIPRLGTNDSFPFGSKTISTYLWTLPTGVTLQGGFATSDQVIGVDATQGQHVISLKVTDSNSKVHTSFTYLFVSDGTNYLDLFEGFSATIDSDSQDINGRTVTFTIRGTDIEETILPASYVHLQHDSLYNGSALTVGVDVDVFVGYVTDYQYSHDGEFGQAIITAVSPYLYLQKVFMPSQVITEVSNPSNWAEVDSSLSNPRGALCYNRWQCQNLFSMHDIDTNSITTPRKFSYEYNGKTVASGLDVAALAIVGNVGSASDGTFVLRFNPSTEDNTFRNALAVGMTFDEFDVIAPLTHPTTVVVPYADVRAGAFGYSGGGINGVKGWYGVKRWAQGASETVLPDFSIVSTDGLSDVLEKVGHIAADLQYPDEQPLTVTRNINVIDPAYMIWYRLNITNDFDPSGEGWDNVRILPRIVNRTWNNAEQTLVIQTTVKRETFGQSADEWVIGSGSTSVSGGWVSELGVRFTPTNENFSVLPTIALAWNTSGDLALTQTFTNESPSWIGLNEFVTGSICDVCFDYNSSFFTSGYVESEPLSVYIATISGTTLSVYRMFDIKASSFQFDLLKTYTMNDSSTTTEARIQCSSATGTLALVVWHDQTGILFGRTTDGGATWSSAANIGDTVTDTDNDNVSIGLYVSGVNQVTTAPDSSVDYGTYLATTAGGAFSILGNSEDNTAPNPMINGDDNTTVYVATDNNGVNAADFDVTFDVGGYASYSFIGFRTTNFADTFPGNPGNAGGANDFPASSTTSGGSFGVAVTFSPALATVDRIDFDFYHDVDWQTDFLDTSPFTLGWRAEVLTVGTIPAETTLGSIVDTDSHPNLNDVYTFPNSGIWQTISFDLTSSAQTNVTTVRPILRSIVVAGGSSTTDRNGDVGIYSIDNIKIFIAGGIEVDPKLYKVTTYTATDSWTDVTPATTYIPKLPYGLGLDVADTDNVELAATDGSTPKYFQSANAASSWSDNGASDNRDAKRIGEAIIYGGNDLLDLSLDAGTTLIDKRGNLSTVWGSVGVVKNVLVLI